MRSEMAVKESLGEIHIIQVDFGEGLVYKMEMFQPGRQGRGNILIEVDPNMI